MVPQVKQAKNGSRLSHSKIIYRAEVYLTLLYCVSYTS